jgi:hypothetical protein
MLNDVKGYFKEEGKPVKYSVGCVESYGDAIAVIRTQVLLKPGKFGVMAVVQK